MKKKFLAAVLILALASALCPAALAAGSDFTIANGILVEYNGAGGDVTIPDGVTYIGDFAFYDRTDLTGVTIPSSVTRIGNNAFCGCSNLADLTIPDSVTSIGSLAFFDCISLTSVTIPGSATIVDPSAFDGCSGLTAISVAADNPAYCSVDGVLFNKDQPELIAYPNGKAGAYTIPDGVVSIRDFAFDGCTGLTDITVPSSVVSIGDYAFKGCTGLTSISVAADNPAYCSADGVLFNKGQTELIAYPNGKVGAYTIPDGVVSIGNCAFEGCTGLTDVTIGDGVVSIGNYAFGGCTGLTDVTIGDGVTEIGYSAFFRCSGLTGVTIGNGVTDIGSDAFYGCSDLTSISVAADNPAYCSADDVLFSKDQTALLAYPGGKAGAYTIPDNVTSIGVAAFSGCARLTDVTIPGSVTSIKSTAFLGCTGLTDITIPDSVTSIENAAFGECANLTGVTIGDSVATIGSSAFYGCTGLTDITVPGSVANIGDSAFLGCTGLTGISIPDSVTSIGDSAFSGCTSLTDVYYGGTQAQWAEASRDFWLSDDVTIHYNACLVPAGQAASGTLVGENSEVLPWAYEADTVTVAAPIPEDEMVMVACFDENGTFTDVKCLSADQLNASVGQPDHFKLIRVDSSLAPQCEAAEVILTP